MDFDATLANTSKTGVGTTSALGCFSRGGSPYGVMELNGNVWEWLLSQFDKYPYPELHKEIRERENYESTKTRALRLKRSGKGAASLSTIKRLISPEEHRDDVLLWTLPKKHGYDVVCARRANL